MNIAVGNPTTHHGRLWINMMKIVAVAVVLGIFLFLRSQPLDMMSVLFWTFVAILGVSSCVALIDISIESCSDAQAAICTLAILSLLLVGVEGLQGYSHGWYREIAFVSIFALPFCFLALSLSFNDTQMDSDTSRYYPSSKYRQAGFLQHLAFNILPYFVGVGGAYFVSTTYGESSAIKFSIGMIAVLLAFVITDESRRHRQHQSFFWENEPTPS